MENKTIASIVGAILMDCFVMIAALLCEPSLAQIKMHQAFWPICVLAIAGLIGAFAGSKCSSPELDWALGSCNCAEPCKTCSCKTKEGESC